MQNSVDDLAARRALISAGIVGGGSLFLTKVFDLKPDIAVPVAIAASLLTDYSINRGEILRTIQFTKKFIRDRVLNGEVTATDELAAYLVAGFVAILGLSAGDMVVQLGTHRYLRAPVDASTSLVPQTVGRMASWVQGGWNVIQPMEMAKRLGANFLTTIVVGAFGKVWNRLTPSVKTHVQMVMEVELEKMLAEGTRPKIILPAGQDDIELNQDARTVVIVNQGENSAAVLIPGAGNRADVIPVIKMEPGKIKSVIQHALGDQKFDDDDTDSSVSVYDVVATPEDPRDEQLIFERLDDKGRATYLIGLDMHILNRHREEGIMSKDEFMKQLQDVQKKQFPASWDGVDLFLTYGIRYIVGAGEQDVGD